MGLGRNKSIIIYDTLVQILTPKELTAIVAHEIGHNKIKQFYFDFSFELIKTGLLFYAFQIILLNDSFFPILGFEHNSFSASTVIFFMLSKPAIFIIDILNNIYSRHMEYRADNYAAKNYCGISLQESLVKISKNNFLENSPLPIYEFLFYSHPSINNRINSIKKL